jgi:hypothetical protein
LHILQHRVYNGIDIITAEVGQIISEFVQKILLKCPSSSSSPSLYTIKYRIVLHLSYKNLIVHDVWCKIWDVDTVITFYLIVELSTIVLQCRLQWWWWWWWWWWHFSKIIFVLYATKNLRHQKCNPCSSIAYSTLYTA